MNGVLVIDKPAGPTSHDVVAVVRRAIGSPKVGHTGTLDPLATGVLPLVIGRATRLASYMSGADKEYVARIRFGVATATYDAEGRDGSGDVPPSAERLSAVAALDERRRARGAPDVRGPVPADASALLRQEGRRDAGLQARPPAETGRDQARRSHGPGAGALRLRRRPRRGQAGVRRAASTCARWPTTWASGSDAVRISKACAEPGPASSPWTTRCRSRRLSSGAHRPPASGWSRWNGSSRCCQPWSSATLAPSARAMAAPCGQKTSP